MRRTGPGTRGVGVALDVGVALAVGLLAWFSAQAARWAPHLRLEGRDRREGPWGDGEWSDGPVWTAWSGPWWAPLPFVAVIVVALALRRRAPRTAFVAVALAVGGFLAVGGPPGPVLLAPAIAVYGMCVALPIRAWAPWTVLLLPMLLGAFWSQPWLGLVDPGTWGLLVVATAGCLVPALLGLLRNNRRQAARAARDTELRRFAYEERLRVAREVHDVVGHSLSVINLQAGVALHVLDTRPGQAAESLGAIRETSRQALAELRTTLEVYRDPEAPLAPASGLERLPDLVAALDAAGRRVEVDDRRTGVPIPAAIDLAALRIVQESLTNVVRHTDADARVVLDDADRTLLITVSDRGRPVAGITEGSGISGMRARARTVGGELVVAATTGGVLVEARLPLAVTTVGESR